MSQSKELFINSVRQVRVQGQSLIPTVVLYKEKKTWVGFDALENSDQVSELREDFKVQIGNDDPIKLAQSRSGSSSGQGRSTLGIAKDFMDAVVAQAMDTIRLQGYEAPSRILVAEPLSLIGTSDRLDHEDWLKNYRGSIRRILGGKFAEIDFMPEPFAVFQYYRYGVKHPLVAQRARQIALVFDFGGRNIRCLHHRNDDRGRYQSKWSKFETLGRALPACRWIRDKSRHRARAAVPRNGSLHR
ncbi:hypothetical protein [Bradyrhizobium sp. USDA 4512]